MEELTSIVIPALIVAQESNPNPPAAAEEDPIVIPMDRSAWVTPVALFGVVALVAIAFFHFIG